MVMLKSCSCFPAQVSLSLYIDSVISCCTYDTRLGCDDRPLPFSGPGESPEHKYVSFEAFGGARVGNRAVLNTCVDPI